jgi:hypothetical protein
MKYSRSMRRISTLFFYPFLLSASFADLLLYKNHPDTEKKRKQKKGTALKALKYKELQEYFQDFRCQYKQKKKENTFWILWADSIHLQLLERSCSSVWLERLPVTQEVAGSSPVSSADKKRAPQCGALFLLVNRNVNPGKSGKSRINLFCVYHAHK